MNKLKKIGLVLMITMIILSFTGCGPDDTTTGSAGYRPNSEIRHLSSYEIGELSLVNPTKLMLRKIIFVGIKHCEGDQGLNNFKAKEQATDSNDPFTKGRYYSQRVIYLCNNGRSITASGGDVQHYILSEKEMNSNLDIQYR